MKRIILFVFTLIVFLSACDADSSENTAASAEAQAGPGMGLQSGMMARHNVPIPEAYEGLTNPVTADEESLARGEELYTTNCATCHGDGGMGDGPAGTTLDPAPAPIAHTSQMLGEDYLFWRISEGGTIAPFNSAMPAWKAALDEQERWDVINYIQALGSGAVTPGQMMGGAAYDPEAEAAQQAEMLATAVDQGLITQEEADTFALIHTALEGLMAQMEEMSGNMATMQDELLTELVSTGTITQEQADTFNEVHDRLLEAGLMQ